MALQVKHTKNLSKADGIDNTVVQPTDWNASHTLTAAAGKVLGTVLGSTTVGELPIAVDASGQAMTPPRGTTAERPASPTAGMLRFNSTTSYLETYNGSVWSSFEVFPAGTRMLFQQTAAPTGWTKDTSQNDKALRVVSGAVGSGGTVAFSSAFASRSVSGSTSTDAVSGTVGTTVLDISQIPAHSHSITLPSQNNTTSTGTAVRLNSNGPDPQVFSTSSAGGGGGHTHSFTGGSHAHSLSGSIDMAVQYIDLIIASKA